MLSKISKKDLIYFFVIVDLVAVLVFITSWRVRNQQDVINIVSVGSGLASILLAMTAIVYAFIQTESSSRQNGAVMKTLNIIQEKVGEINVVKDQLALLRRQSEQITDLLKEGVGSKVDSLVDSIKMKEEDIPTPIFHELMNDVQSLKKEFYDELERLGKNENVLVITMLDQLIDQYININVRIGESFGIGRVLDYLRDNEIVVDDVTVWNKLNKYIETGKLRKIAIHSYTRIS